MTLMRSREARKKKVGQNQYLKFLLHLCILRSQKSNIGLNGRFLQHINRLTTLKKLKHFYGLIGVTLAFSFVKEVCMYSKREKKNASPDIDDYQATKAEESEDKYETYLEFVDVGSSGSITAINN